MRRLFILSMAEAPEEPVQGGEIHASPPVGLQVPLVEEPVPEGSEAGAEDVAGVESTGLVCTAAAAAEEVTTTARAVVVVAAALLC